MKNIKHIIIAGLYIFTSTAYGADETASFGVAPKTVPMATPASSAAQDTSFKKSSGITDSADKTKDANKKGQMLNNLMGAANLGMAANCFGQCGGGGGGCCPMAPIFLLMGLQNLAQAGAQGGTAGQAAGTVGQTDIGNSGYDPNAVKNDPELKKGLDFVASMTNADPKKGFSYDPATKTVTAANGKTLKSSDVNSAAAMEAAGVSKSVIDGVTSMSEKNLAAAMKKVDSKYGKIAVNGEEGSSGGGGGASSATATTAYAEVPGRSGLGIDRDPAQVAGMQKNYNGEPIGVSGDSIFKMMTRRYKTKESQNNFLEDAELLIQK